VSGLGIGRKSDGSEIPFFTAGRKAFYYDKESNDTNEVDTSDVLPEAAEDDDVSIFPYNNIAGSFVYISSPNSSIYKINVANPGSIKDLTPDSTIDGGTVRFKGWY